MWGEMPVMMIIYITNRRRSLYLSWALKELNISTQIRESVKIKRHLMVGSSLEAHRMVDTTQRDS